MLFRLVLALSISVLLIGVASWFRFGTTEYAQPNIVAIEQLGVGEGSYEDILHDFLEPKTASSTFPQGSLSNTDLIGRQLILDYIGLAASGQATEANITALANEYVEKIPTLHKTGKIVSQDIKALPDTKTNIKNYSDELARVYKEHAEHINAVNANNLGTSNNIYTPFAESMAIIYKGTALKLKGFYVPLSLVPLHLELVNTHLSSAAAMNSIFETEKDPVTAFAGLITMSKNLDEEVIILKEIDNFLKTNAI